MTSMRAGLHVPGARQPGRSCPWLQDITVWTGRKFVKKVERAFFQRNGPVLMILVVVFGMSMWHLC